MICGLFHFPSSGEEENEDTLKSIYSLAKLALFNLSHPLLLFRMTSNQLHFPVKFSDFYLHYRLQNNLSALPLKVLPI